MGFVTPVWICLSGLPLYCWGGRNVAIIAAGIGDPLWLDSATERMERGHYARVCVRVDLKKPLRTGIWVEGPYGSFFQKIEYEGFSSFCFNCGQVGHKANACGWQGGTVKPVENNRQDLSGTAEQSLGASKDNGNMEEGNMDGKIDAEVCPKGVGEGSLLQGAKDDNVEVQHSLDPGFGPWMLVARRKPPKNKNRPFSKTGSGHGHQKPMHDVIVSSKKQEWNKLRSTGNSVELLAQGGKVDKPALVVGGLQMSSLLPQSVGPHIMKAPGEPVNAGELTLERSVVVPNLVQTAEAEFTFNAGSRGRWAYSKTDRGGARQVKTYKGREVGKLGPITSEGRPKRRRHGDEGGVTGRHDDDGGDASPMVDQ